MIVNEKLNFVIPLYRADDSIYAYVHATPLSREVFEANFLLISKTFSAIHGEGLGEIAGPRVAALVMREIAKSSGREASAKSVLNEIRRLAYVLAPGADGGAWTMMVLQDAIDHKTIDPDDAGEVENALVFFTVFSAMHKKQVIREILDGAANLWGARTSLLSCSAFVDSLPISTATATSDEITSSVPS